jgi:hypothetical protein
MTASPFGINVVSRSHRVACGACGAKAFRVTDSCTSCGATFAESGFAIVAVDSGAVRAVRQRLALRKAPAA